MMALRRPALVGGGNGSSAPPAGLLGGVRCRSHGVRAGSAHVDRGWRNRRRRLQGKTQGLGCQRLLASRLVLKLSAGVDQRLKSASADALAPAGRARR